MNFPKTKLTRAGLNAVTEVAYAGKKLTFTGCKLGSGAASNSDWELVTDLTHVEQEIGITAITVDEHVATIRFILENSSLSSGFYMRELGIYARVDDIEEVSEEVEESEAEEESEESEEEESSQGEEFLYAYTNAGANAGYIKPYDADDFVTLDFSVIVAIGNAETIEAVINGAVGYVTIPEFNYFKDHDFEDHITNYNNPHRVTRAQLGLENVVNLAPNNYTITFTVPATLAPITSGSKLSIYIGMLARAILSIRDHLMDSNNPHQVTPAKIGAAPVSHTHSASDITGTLPISKGGTGVTTLPALKTLVAKSRTYIEHTLVASEWDGRDYSLETLYGSSAYDLDVELSVSATNAQRKAFSSAAILGSRTSNVLHATGTVPGINIPVVIKVMEK